MLFYTAGTGDVRPVLCSTVFITVEQIKKLNLESRAVVPDGKFSSWIRGRNADPEKKTGKNRKTNKISLKMKIS